MEYVKVNNYCTALLSLKIAKKLSKSDPYILNELGYVFYKQKKYLKA